jgi:acyl-CoA thioesterase FadM
MRRMQGYRHVCRRTVEFRDVDAAEHVNNAGYLTYLESAPIEYRREIRRIDHLDRTGDGRFLTEATSVLVAYDYGPGAPMPVPDDWRTHLETYEERSSVTA